MVGHIQRAGNQTANVHLTALTKDNAIRVKQKHLPVGIELAINLAGIASVNAVKRHAVDAGLGKVDLCLSANIKTLPMDNGLVAVLGNVHARGALLNVGLPGHNLPTCGQLLNGWGSQK